MIARQNDAITNSGPIPMALIAFPTVRSRIKPAAISTATVTSEVTSRAPSDFAWTTVRGWAGVEAEVEVEVKSLCSDDMDISFHE